MSNQRSPVALHNRKLLFRKAEELIQFAYAPYSHFRVGAAVLTEAGNIYGGCNVENGSYGLAVCAERVAIFNAIASEGPGMKLRAIAVQCDRGGLCSPCGACRQVIVEFGRQATVFFQDCGEIVECDIATLLPVAFVLSDE